MAITNYQSITDLFDVPIERMRDLKTRWVDDKEKFITCKTFVL